MKPRQEEGLWQAIEGFVRCVITWGPVRSQGRTYMENCEPAVISGTLAALKSGWVMEEGHLSIVLLSLVNKETALAL